MDANGVVRNSTTGTSCAEPGCHVALAARKGGQTYLIHCADHRTSHSGVRDDFPPCPTTWGRRSCTSCGAMFEKYLSQMQGATDRVFCCMACRNEAGAKPRGIQPRKCDWCPRTYHPKSKTKPSRFCTQVCYDAWKAAQPRTRRRPSKYSQADLDEVRICPEPGCEEKLPPRNPSNGYRVKWCPTHRKRGRDGRAHHVDPSKKVTLECFYCGEKFERYKTNVRYNSTNRYYCSAEHRKIVGTKPRTQPWFKCEWCGEDFQGRPGALNRFHAKECQTNWQRREQTTRQCAHCARKFVKPKGDPDIYCSSGCYGEARKTPDGKRVQNPDGYIQVYKPGHCEAQASGWVLEHRMVMSDLLGRPLYRGEEVHHRWARDDNRPEALELWDKSHPAGQRVSDRYRFYKEWIERVDRERPILEAAGVTFHDDEPT